jgi:formylglycine-generating enzyme required for sulfatase activity
VIERRLLAARAAAGALALAGCIFACGSDAVEPDDGTGAGHTTNGLPNVGPALAQSTCETDKDCAATNGGKCVPVGGGQKACVASKSCTGGPGADKKCGGTPGDDKTVGSADCCQTVAVPGGSFNRFNDPLYPAKIDPYLLDAYEVTAGRFRAWVEATNGNLRGSAPKAGAGAHPKVANSGWRNEWNTLLPTSRSDVDSMLGPEGCQEGGNIEDFGTLTWWTKSVDSKVRSVNSGNPAVLAENTKTALDGKPVNCIPWHVLMAFCIWDGGRLPTDAEWSFAAQAGAEQRAFPWGSLEAKDLIHVDNRNDLSLVPLLAAGSKYISASLYDPSLGPNKFPDNYVHTWGGPFRSKNDNASHVPPVGRRALGNGKWGHADLVGGMYEWTMDEGPIRPGTCDNCANVSYPALDKWDPNAAENIPDFLHKWFAGGARSVRGGAWDNSLGLANTQTDIEIETYTSSPVGRTYRSLGGRCARDP